MIYVIGENIVQADFWVREHRKKREPAEVLRSPAHVLGRRFREEDVLDLVGTFWRRRDLRQIIGYVHASAVKGRAKQMLSVTTPMMRAWQDEDLRNAVIDEANQALIAKRDAWFRGESLPGFP